MFFGAFNVGNWEPQNIECYDFVQGRVRRVLMRACGVWLGGHLRFMWDFVLYFIEVLAKEGYIRILQSSVYQVRLFSYIKFTCFTHKTIV